MRSGQWAAAFVLTAFIAAVPSAQGADDGACKAWTQKTIKDGLGSLENLEFDDAGAIGRRYRRQDEIGTPFCITVDFETLDDDAVTIRERDTMTQERIGIDQVEAYLAPRLLGA